MPELTVELDQEEYERLSAAADEEDPETLLREGGLREAALRESIEFTQAGGFREAENLAATNFEEAPRMPAGELVGFDIVSAADGEAVLTLDAGPEHGNPMGTIHGGILCDVGDAAMGTAYASTLDADESFTTLELKVNFLRPVWSDRLEAVGRVRGGGSTIGLVECEITNSDGAPVAYMTSTCMTLRGESASGR